MTARVSRFLRYAAAAGVPLVLFLSALTGAQQPAVFTALILLLGMVPFFLRFERSRPQIRQIVPIALLSAVATVGRIAFAFAPNFKPTTAVILIAGFCFGPTSGFLTGAMTALASNFFFGQGAWTPWQMVAWGLVGFIGGLLSRTPLSRKRIPMAAVGVISAFLFGLVMSVWHVLAFVRPLTLPVVLAAYATGFVFDLLHAGSTALFLSILGPSWVRRIRRVRDRYGLVGSAGDSSCNGLTHDPEKQ